MKRRTWLWASLSLALLTGASYALYFTLRPPPLPDQLLYGNGHIEGTEVRVAAEVAGRVVESRLVEGRTVARGDLLIRIDDRDLTLRKEQADADVEGLEQDRERAARSLEVARHHLETAERDLTRYRALGQEGGVSPQRIEQAENVFQEARGQAARLATEVGAIGARIKSARKQLDLVLNDLTKASVSAPIDGTILAKGVEAGEFVQPGRPIATLVDLTRVELTVYIPEQEIGTIRLGQEARVQVDAFPDRTFEARVSRVDQSAQFTPRDIHMPEERVRMVFGVTLALDNPVGVLKPGMPADAWILRDALAGWPGTLAVPR